MGAPKIYTWVSINLGQLKEQKTLTSPPQETKLDYDNKKQGLHNKETRTQKDQ
jgi:hypothetical protein